MVLNNLIGAKTNVNYHITPLEDNKIVIPIYPYTNEEIKGKPTTLISDRFDTVVKFLNTLSAESLSTKSRWLVRNMQKLGVDLEEDFQVRVEVGENKDSGFQELVNFKFKGIEKENFEQIRLKDGSVVNIYVDPYSSGYGLFLDLSVKFEDMGMGYNALHLYEHLATKAWASLSNEHVKDLNGATYPSGISYIYIILNNCKSFKDYVNATFEWIVKSRTQKYWKSKEANDFIEVETLRTISETREERMLSSTGRTDQKGYNLIYNTDIFHYWSNRPFNILLSVKSMDELKFLSLNKLSKREKVKRPPNIKFSRMPLDVIKAKEIQQIHIVRVSPVDIVNNIFSSSLENMLYGLNCGLVSTEENLSGYNSILFPLLFLPRFVKTEKIKKYISKNIIPYDCSVFGSIPVHNVKDDFEPEKEKKLFGECDFKK
jgi:hypothetical protein